jgi:hypothetical protein
MESTPQSAAIMPGTSAGGRQLFQTPAFYVFFFWAFLIFVLAKGSAILLLHRGLLFTPVETRADACLGSAVAIAIFILMFRLYRVTDVRTEKLVFAIIQLDYLVVAAHALRFLMRAAVTIPHEDVVTLSLGLAITFLTGIRAYSVTHSKGNPWIPSA